MQRKVFEDQRITARLNPKEQAELNLFMQTYHIDKPSEAMKVAVKWCNTYLKFVTEAFIPPGYDLVLLKRTQANQTERKIYY